MLGVRRQRSWGDGPHDPDGGVERLPRPGEEDPRTEVRHSAALWTTGRVDDSEKTRRCEGENEEVIRKMLRIDHGRSGTSCGSKNENAGSRECKGNNILD